VPEPPLDLDAVVDIGRRAGQTVSLRTNTNCWQDDIEQEAILGAWKEWLRGSQDERKLYGAGRRQAIECLRDITKHRWKTKRVLSTIPIDQSLYGEGHTAAEFLADWHLNAEDRMSETLDLWLTHRERQIAELLAQGYFMWEVGEILGVTESRICQLVGKLRQRYPEHALGRRRITHRPHL
jgi:DNA-binding CsgD family transcriptional regulator